jgi:hypothetical protein
MTLVRVENERKKEKIRKIAKMYIWAAGYDVVISINYDEHAPFSAVNKCNWCGLQQTISVLEEEGRRYRSRDPRKLSFKFAKFRYFTAVGKISRKI